MSRFSKAASVFSIILLTAFGASLLAQGTKIVRRAMTEEEFNRFKNEVGVAVPGRDYNVIVEGHGTGLRPPTEEQWAKVRFLPVVAESVEPASVALPGYVDQSATPYFPPIGNQDGEGSCTAWATTYYIKTYQEAKEHDWDLTGCLWEGGYYGYPSAAYQDLVFSPDFVYHLINGGRDRGSWFWDAIDLMEGIGAASWLNMPYDPRDSSAWPGEVAWRQAPVYRGDAYFFIDITTDEGIGDLKALLAGGNLAVIGVDANLYSTLSEDDLWTSDTYTVTSVNHANTLVGYDDDFGPYVEGGETKYGAFKVANSWGVGSWENDPDNLDGFYWISPQTLMRYIFKAHCYENITGYRPGMVTVFEIDHSYRGDCEVEVTIGSEGVKSLNDFVDPGTGYLPFPDNKMVLDVTEWMPQEQRGTVQGALGVYDGPIKFTGTVEHFSVEIYDDYLSGAPAATAVSSDTPLVTVNGATVYATVRFPGGFFRLR